MASLLLALPAAAQAAAPFVRSTAFSAVTKISASLQVEVVTKENDAEVHFEYVSNASYNTPNVATASKGDFRVPLSVTSKDDLSVGPVTAAGTLTKNFSVITHLENHGGTK
jgi:hypothetical protein